MILQGPPEQGWTNRAAISRTIQGRAIEARRSRTARTGSNGCLAGLARPPVTLVTTWNPSSRSLAGEGFAAVLAPRVSLSE